MYDLLALPPALDIAYTLQVLLTDAIVTTARYFGLHFLSSSSGGRHQQNPAHTSTSLASIMQLPSSKLNACANSVYQVFPPPFLNAWVQRFSKTLQRGSDFQKTDVRLVYSISHRFFSFCDHPTVQIICHYYFASNNSMFKRSSCVHLRLCKACLVDFTLIFLFL